MSPVIHSRVCKAARRLGVLTCLSVLGSAATAFAACPAQPLSNPFSQWADTNQYFMVPGGSFEGTADQVGWTLSNASLTAGNEPFYVNSSADQQSLTINARGSATSPFFCVDNSMPDLRLFAQQTVAGSDLKITALVQTAAGVSIYPVGSVTNGSITSWAPTNSIALNSGSIPNGSTLMVALRFEVPAGTGAWQIDDAYVDPYRAG